MHIVLEGPDASGKKTQTELLVSRLREQGVAAERVSFPDYEGPFGRLVREYLEEKTPSGDPAFASVLYAADRFTHKQRITDLLAAGTWVISDRYVPSNLAHQVARMREEAPEQAEALADWIEHMEYEVLGLPQADLTILLNVAYDISHQKAAQRSQTEQRAYTDRHEQASRHLRLAWEEYQRLAGQYQWPVIDCSPKGELLPREEIAEKIWHTVQAQNK